MEFVGPRGGTAWCGVVIVAEFCGELFVAELASHKVESFVPDHVCDVDPGRGCARGGAKCRFVKEFDKDSLFDVFAVLRGDAAKAVSRDIFDSPGSFGPHTSGVQFVVWAWSYLS